MNLNFGTHFHPLNEAFLYLLQSSSHILIHWRRLSILILIYIKLKNRMETHKHGNKENLSIKKSFSSITCKLVIRKKACNNRNLNKKSSSSSTIVYYTFLLNYIHLLNILNIKVYKNFTLFLRDFEWGIKIWQGSAFVFLI